MPTNIYQSIETTSEYFLSFAFTYMQTCLKRVCGVTIQALLRSPTRTDHPGTHCRSSERLLTEKSNYTKEISQSCLGTDSLLRMVNLFTFW